jgi:hypothetical protein
MQYTLVELIEIITELIADLEAEFIKKLVKMHGETHNKIVDMLQNNLDSKDLKNLVTILNKVVSKV